jgi:DNA-binding MarR family transcriptional regulator
MIDGCDLLASILPMSSDAGRAAVSASRAVGAALEDDLSFLLARANALSLAAGNAAMAVHGLKVRSYSVLALAASDVRPSQRELAEFLRLDPSQVVALVDELQARGLVIREADPADRRANVVTATESGRAVFARAEVSARAAEAELHSSLSSTDRERLTALLRAIAFPD